MLERLAAHGNGLVVRCFVGEEHSSVRNVENGWFSNIVTERKGRAILGDLGDPFAFVHWDAPEGATLAPCTLEPIRWAYVTLHVEEEGGGAAPGVGVMGCGVLQETGEDGMVEFPVPVLDKPCIFEIFRWNGVDTYDVAFARIGPLTDGEQRMARVSLRAFPVEAEASTPSFDRSGLEDLEDGATVVPPLLDPPSLADKIEDYADRLAGTSEWIEQLEAVLSETPADERWVVEEELDQARQRRTSFAEHLAELEAESEDVRDVP